MFNIIILTLAFYSTSLDLNTKVDITKCGCNSSDEICLRALQSCLDEVSDYDTVLPSTWGGEWVRDAYVAGCGLGYIKCKNRRQE